MTGPELAFTHKPGARACLAPAPGPDNDPGMDH
jgi:hypothetical protein